MAVIGTHGEWFEYAVAELLARNPKLTRETIEADGSTTGDVCHAIAVVADEAAARIAGESEGNFLDSAEGDKLTRLGVDRYGVQRKGDEAAVVPLTLSRQSPAPAITVPAGAVFSVNGLRYALDAGFAWALSNLGPVTLAATALQTGPESNLGANMAGWRVETALGDATISVHNLTPATGGAVGESDEQYKGRLRSWLDRYAKGTGEAIRLSALDLGTVRSASIYMARDDDGRPTGGGYLVVADASGAANAIVVAQVQEKIEDAMPFGGWTDVLGGVVRLEDVTVTAAWDPGSATTEKATALKQAIEARMNALEGNPNPDDLPASDASILSHAFIQEVRPLIQGLKRITVNLPVGSVEPAQGEFIRPNVVTVQ